MADDFAVDTLTSKLGVIDDLERRLVHVKWSRENFVLLAQAIREALASVGDQSEYAHIGTLLTRLQPQVDRYVGSGKLPHGAERESLLATLDALASTLAKTGQDTADSPSSRPTNSLLAIPNEIVILAGENAAELIEDLKDAGFRVHHLYTMTAAKAKFSQTKPRAAIIDMDFPEGALFASMSMLAEGSDRLDPDIPILFLSERGDLAARLEAVSAGGAGYFTKPVDMPALLSTLNDRLFYELLRGCRVLIVQDNPTDARKTAAVLEAKGAVTRLVDPPVDVIRELYEFHADLLVLDLDLREVEGTDLARAIRQHKDFETLPQILLSTHVDPNRQLAVLNAGVDWLLSKSVAANHLPSAVALCLRRSRILSHKFSDLQQRDTVSGLYNRRYFFTQLRRALKSGSPPVAVMLITLDNLRAVEAKDMFAADEVIAQASKRLQAVLGAGQQACRFSDAIFAVLSEGTEREALSTIARTVRETLEIEAYTAGREFVQLRTSVGVSIASAGEEELGLLQHANQACSSAWVAGRDRIHIYDPITERVADTSQQQRLLEEIREAVEQQRLSLVYQPIVSLRGDPTERYEVLLRIRNQDGTELLPSTVFTTTQRHRLGMMLDRWVIGQSIRLLRGRRALNQTTTLFINISPAILQDNDFLPWLKGTLDKTGVPATELIFEMTEATAERHVQEVSGLLAKVKRLGCEFSLDRFGGREQQSLELLNSLPVNYVKLDAHFTHELAKVEEKQKRLKQLTQKLNTAGITTIAGSIENLPTLLALSSCGISYVQGFFLQRPQEDMTYNFASGTL